MKKLILALLAVGSISTANAQRNSVLMYGNAGVATDNVDYGPYNLRTTTWGINPGVGYQVTNHLTLGLEGGFNQHRTPITGATITGDNTLAGVWYTQVNNDWGIAPFLRVTHYLGNIFYVYNQISIGYVAGTYEYEGLSPRAFYNGLQTYWYPAIGAFVGKGFALNFNVGGVNYRYTNTDQGIPGSINIDHNTFAIGFGHQINIGISRNIGCGSMHRYHGHHEPGDDTRHMNMSDDDDDDAPAPRAHKAKKMRSDDDDE
jgi:hypothetical protein